ncbi:MAG: hypothetical protein WCS77_05660, partial [Elusimicrobiaceae bacterium]
AGEATRKTTVVKEVNTTDQLKARLKLQGIVGTQVIIDDKVYGVGDYVKMKGFSPFPKITAIKGTKVWFQYKGSNFYKELPN